MPVLGLLFLRYAYSRFVMVKEQILKENPGRPDRPFIIKESHFKAKSALLLPELAQYKFLLEFKENVASMKLTDVNGQLINSLGEALTFSTTKLLIVSTLAMNIMKKRFLSTSIICMTT